MNMLSLIVAATMPCLGVGPLQHAGSLTDGLRSPARIAVGADSTVYVTDAFNRHIARYDAGGALLGTWSVPEGPIGIAVHSDGRYFVSLRDEPKVAIYDSMFTRTGFLGDGNPIVTFVRPTDIDIASDTGRIYVVDAGGDRVYGFESDGTLALVFGTHGELIGEFQYPSAISVDEANQRLIVADHDNFRVQLFTVDGVFVTRFGYRNKYVPGGGQEGWMPRTQGLAVDDAGRIYVADAMMGTVRVFDATTSELGKVVDYGFNPGNVRVPCDIVLSPDGLRLYVVSTSTSSVEIYETPIWSAQRATGGSVDAAIAPAGSNECEQDRVSRSPRRLNKKRTKRSFGLRPLISGTVVEEWIDLLGAAGAVDATSADSPGFDGPHMVDASIICGRCHGINGQPGGHLGLLEGQNVLCMSCHSAGGQALQKPLHELDPADPYATNPAVPDSQGRSHAWGVPATSTAADSVGPAAGSPMGDHLDNGLIKCSTCHEQHNSDADAPYLRRRNDQDQMCKECHAPRNEGLGERGTHPVGFAYPAGQGEFPLAGDVGPLFIKSGRVECMTCHALHNADSGGANAGQGDGMLLRAANDETLCQTCHREHNGHTPSGSWQPTCNDCHEAHDPDNENLSLVALTVHNQTLDAQMPVTFTSRTGANSFDDGDPAVNDGICQVCHTATAYHRYDGTGGAHNDGAVCTSCHPHSAGFMPAGGASCIACHSSPQDNGDNVPPGGRHAVVNADGTGGHHLAGGVLTDTDCVICHEMSQHRQGTVRLWTDPNNPTTPLPLTGDPNELVPFCTNCHDSLTHPTVHTTGATWEPVCTQCHEVHDPANGNLSLVNDVVRNETLGVDRPVVFTSRTGANSFDDGDPAVNDGICQVCHTATAHHLYDGTSAPHNDGADCTACHPHQSGFLPTNASCQDCHAVSQGTRRPVVAEFSRASHHLQGGLLDDADCEVCHDMSQHQGGSVRLKNVDDPANPAAVTVLTGNPATDSTEAVKLEAFCLACHDNNGANGVAPFTDGIMPAPIDATLWASGSHQVGPMTCFGDGQTFGCHDTGHGSNKQKLLAPSTVAPTPPANAEEQEGFCYTCHDADGPASTDIESLFVLSSHHNVTFADQADGSKVECTNCHNPHTASSTALLADPDTGDPWTGIGPGFCLACHDGAPPQGVTFPSGSTGSGFDKSGFVGTTHATNLGGNTCRHCHMDHGSTYASLLRDQYVTTDYNQHTLGDGDYAVCWICHDESATIEQTNAFKNLHKRHVDGARGPCIICHDVHGGFDSGEPGLINFENSVQNGYDILFIDGRDASSAFYLNAAQDAGNCYLKCHNKNHNPKTYPRTPNPLVDCSACHVP